MANEIYDSTWWGNTIETASSIGTSTEMIQGQFNMLTSNQPNLVVNGDFATDSDWNKGIGWSISGGKANCDGTNSPLDQFSITTIGKTYKVDITVTDMTTSSVNVRLGTGSSDIIGSITSNGTYTFYGTVASNTTFRIRSSAGFDGSIDNVSVKEVRATTVEAVKCLADAIHRIGIQDIQN